MECCCDSPHTLQPCGSCRCNDHDDCYYFGKRVRPKCVECWCNGMDTDATMFVVFRWLCTKHLAMRGIPMQTCNMCNRPRTLRDAYDYNPLQVVTNQPLGWYSDDDGEMCPECMTKIMRDQ